MDDESGASFRQGQIVFFYLNENFQLYVAIMKLFMSFIHSELLVSKKF